MAKHNFHLRPCGLACWLLTLAIFAITACGGGSGNSGGGTSTPTPTPTPTPSTANEWTWESGSDTAWASGVYTTLGNPSTTNVPSARGNAVSWNDTSGNLWLFGGFGTLQGKGGNEGYLNDLWEFTPATKAWTWVSGSDAINASCVYGKLGIPSTSNVPGARYGAVSWTDTSGNLWLFGGDYFADLWEFTPATKAWTWMGGSNTAGATGMYGTLGTPSTSNSPGARTYAVSWSDASGNFWLFGGSGSAGPLNDLWMYNPTNKTWTWVSGSNTAFANGTYGTLGIPSTTNVPGSREQWAASWIDGSGNLWLFGGQYTLSSIDYFNDLWEFTPATKAWTWVSGSDAINASGVYGLLGTPSLTNAPGARTSAVSWTDPSGNFWLFGGAAGGGGNLNDLWEFSSTSKMWTWVGGSNTTGTSGVYGTLGTPSSGNVPGARSGAVSWIDTSGNFWLFGGGGQDGTGSGGLLNDLWRYQP